MMMFLGLILLVVYAVGTIKGGFFVDTLAEGKNVEKYMESDEFKNMSGDEQGTYALKLLTKTIIALVVALVLSFITLCFLIGALSVDVILVPTVVLLALIVIKAIRVIASKEYREKINKRPTGTFRNRLSNGVYFLYVLYILILIVL